MRYKVSFEKALEECANSPDFLIKLKSGSYIYVESYFCLNQPKYISWDKTIATMTAYARGHKSECCLPFTPERICDQACKAKNKTPVSEALVKPKPQHKPKIVKVDDSKASQDAERFKTMVHDIDELAKKLPRDFPGTLDKLIKWREVKEEDLAESANLSEKTIQRLRRHEPREVTLETVIQLCIGLHLPPTLSNYLLAAAGRSFTNTKKHNTYSVLLYTCYPQSIDYCNELLTGMGFPALGRKKDSAE